MLATLYIILSHGAKTASKRLINLVIIGDYFHINSFSIVKFMKLSRDFYNRNTIQVAQELLGKHLTHVVNGEIRIGKIVEVEAYIGSHDLACHAAKGLTNRTRVMFGPPGHAYVYLIYGMHYCMNAVTENAGHGSGVLIRAVEPIQHINGRTQGPGLVCKAMSIDKTKYGHDLTSDDFFIAHAPNESHFSIVKKPRIGVAYAKHWSKRLLRFYIKNNAFVSKR